MGGIEHTNWQRALMLWCSQETSLIASPEVTIRVAESRYRIADLAIFLQPPQGAIVSQPPLAVIEILSPSDSFRRVKGRMRDYERMGVRNLLVIESRTEFSEFKDDKFLPILGERTALEGSGSFIDWKAAAGLLWPNPES